MHYEFADLVLDTGSRRLSRAEETIKLTKLSFNVLQALVEASPNLLTHDQLIDQAWGAARVVSPENLSQRIMMLRQSIGDDANSPVYIEVIHGQGYRLIPSVTATSTSTEPATAAADQPARSQPPTSRTVRRRWLLITAIIAVAAIATLFFWIDGNKGYKRQADSSGDTNFESVAVLPFSNLSPDAANSFFAAGIHEEVLNQLAKLTGLRVISRTSMLRYENTRDPIPTIARELEVDSLVEGSVRYADNRIRVTVQLVDGDSDVHLWSQTYDRELKDVFEIESEIARDVAIALDQVIAEDTQGNAVIPPTNNLEAYSQYMMGRQVMVSRRSEDLQQALQHFRNATTLDPNYALAWVGVADAISLVALYGATDMRDSFQSRQTAIDRALELDPTSAEAWLSLAELRKNQQRIEEAEKYFLRSIELNPGNSQAYHWYAILLRDQGRLEEALTQIRKALNLDPLGPSANTVLAGVLWYLGRAEEALVAYRKIIALDPNYPLVYWGYSNNLASLGRLDEARYWAGHGAALDPTYIGNRANECRLSLALGDDTFTESCLEKLNQDFPQMGYFATNYDLYMYREEYAEFLADMKTMAAKINEPWADYVLGMAYLLNADPAASRDIFAPLWPPLYDDENISLKPWEVQRATIEAAGLYYAGETERANYLFDEALHTMQSMHRTRGLAFGLLDTLIHATRGETDKAVTALRDGIDSGSRLGWWQLRGPGFVSVENDPAWQALFAELVQDVQHQRENFEKHKNDPEYWTCKAESSC